MLDVLETPFAEIRERDRQPVADGRPHGLRNADSPGLREVLDARGSVDAVAIDVAAVLDHVAEIHADSKFDLARRARIRVADRELGLNLQRALQRVERGVESREHGVARIVDDTPFVPHDGRSEQIEMIGQRPMGRVFRFPHQSAVARDVCVENSRQLARHVFMPHRARIKRLTALTPAE